eukprot:9479374-Pyramimonas_sp.AAC.1
MPPRGSQENPKRPPRGTQDAPRGFGDNAQIIDFTKVSATVWPSWRGVCVGGALLKMAPRAPGRAQDDLQDGSRYTKMSHNRSYDAPSCPKTAPSGQRAPPRGPEEAKTFGQS